MFKLLLLILFFCGAEFYSLAPVSADMPLEHFEKKIRPLLVKYCYECHSADAKKLGGKLRLDTVAGLKSGGETGQLFAPKNIEASLIIQAIRHEGLNMPPDKSLTEAEIHEFEQWINNGAILPEAGIPAIIIKSIPIQSDHGAFQHEIQPHLPEVNNQSWVKNPIDKFVLAKMTVSGMSPAGECTPRTLIRRLYADLLGLIPSITQITDFEKSCATNRDEATEKLVDQLLSSPHFGERWGRHWLDVARYAESNGNDGLGRNHTFPHAWRYRDYVINAFNIDLPYNEFIREQIAGDLLNSKDPQVHDRQLIATGFLALTAKPAAAMNDNFKMDVVADQLDVIGKGLLGLSIGCARCHDHKFDPIPTRDYYALAGIFTSTETLWGTAANENLTAPPTDLHILKATPPNMPPPGFVENVLLSESDTGIIKPVTKPKWPAGTPLAMGVRDRQIIANCKINIKGESKKTGEEVSRGFLSVCRLENQNDKFDEHSSGRLQLAEWIIHPEHPLTARVFVNRIWLHLMGNGIVRTPDDFGIYGEKPSHPELLDHLSIRFKQDGWSVKKMIRNIVLSNSYQQESLFTGDSYNKDPQNILYARFQDHRMDAETIRDCMLLVCGELELEPKKGSQIEHRDILMNLAGNLHQYDNHRSIYQCYLRNSLPPDLTVFDLPEFTSTVGRRTETTMPNQALYLFNNQFVINLSHTYAKNLLKQKTNAEDKIIQIFQDTLQRNPSREEIYRSQQLVQQLEENEHSMLKSWAGLTQSLLLTNEFRYID